MRPARKDEVDIRPRPQPPSVRYAVVAPLRQAPACHPTPRYASRISVLARLRVLPARRASTQGSRCSSHRSKALRPRRSAIEFSSRARSAAPVPQAPRQPASGQPPTAASAADDGKRIFRDVPPRHGETETKAFIADTNRHVAAVDRKLKIFAADVRRRAETETHWLERQAFPQ